MDALASAQEKIRLLLDDRMPLRQDAVTGQAVVLVPAALELTAEETAALEGIDFSGTGRPTRVAVVPDAKWEQAKLDPGCPPGSGRRVRGGTR